MKRANYSRAAALGEYIAEHSQTVRGAAKAFGISKSTVHKEITTRLPATHPELWQRVRAVLDTNLSQRHLRGGEATKRKYRDIKKRQRD
ncbi:MAG: sporulation transcriptional regulator SpoIIID [Clostridia bacterium]|nr:sporulation transcriptional regulator SpoIIID [Clostridia bacterium]